MASIIDSHRACPLPGHVVGGAVRDAGADHRQPQRDVDRLVHPQQFERDVTLVMIHGDNRIEFAGRRRVNKVSAGKGPLQVHPCGDSALHRRADDPDLLVPEQTTARRRVG